jgi:hypothetical protein
MTHWAFVINAGVYTVVLVSIVKTSSDDENSYNKALIVAVRLIKFPNRFIVQYFLAGFRQQCPK